MAIPNRALILAGWIVIAVLSPHSDAETPQVGPSGDRPGPWDNGVLVYRSDQDPCISTDPLSSYVSAGQ